MSENIFLSGPAVAKLLCLSQVSVFLRMQKGDFGPVVKRTSHKIGYVALAKVEQFAKSKFTEAQINLAIGNQPARRLVIPNTLENV